MPRRPHCHLAHTRGGSQRAFHPAGLRFNTIHFIFPTTQNWIKAAPVRGRGWREGGGISPTDHPPPSPPPRPTAGGHTVGVVGAGPLLLARVSSGPKAGSGEAARAGHTPPDNCPSKARRQGTGPSLGAALSSGQDSGRHCQQPDSQAYVGSGGGCSHSPPLTPAFPFPDQAPPWHRVLGWQGVGMGTQETQPLCSPPTAWPPGSP